MQHSPTEVQVTGLQRRRLAPAQPAEAQCQHERPPLLPQMLSPGAFVGECEQPGYGQVHATALAPRQFGELDVFTGVVEYEPVPHGHAADAEHGLVRASHGWSARVLDDVADPCLDFGAGDGADPTVGPSSLAVEPPCVGGVDPRGLLPEGLFLLQPLLVEVSNTSFAVLRVNIAVGGLGDGDVLGRPVLRVDLAAESALVGLRAIRLAIPHTVSGFAFGCLVSGDVSHFITCLIMEDSRFNRF